MKTLPTEWKTYVGRKRLNIRTWLKAKGIKDYDGLVAHCKANMIVPPPKKDVRSFFEKAPRKKVTAKKVEKPIPTKAPVVPVVNEDEKVDVDAGEQKPKVKRTRSKRASKKDDSAQSE